MDNELRHHLLLTPCSLFTAPEHFDQVMQTHELIFRRISPLHYRCMDCASANLHWIGRRDEVSAHVELHSEMARWYESRILPTKRT